MKKIEYFGQIPPDTMKKIAAKSAAVVLMKMWHYASADGTRIYPGNDRLARELGIAKSTVKEAIKLLIGLDLIEKSGKLGGRSGDGKHWATEYRLKLPASRAGSSAPENEISRAGIEPPQGPESDISRAGSSAPTRVLPTRVLKPEHSYADCCKNCYTDIEGEPVWGDAFHSAAYCSEACKIAHENEPNF